MNPTHDQPKASQACVDTAAVQAIGAILIDVACPECGYNLRGLPGPVVDCPECGLTSDVPVLATRQWTKPWYKAPGFNTITWPAGWVLTCFFGFAFLNANTELNLSAMVFSFIAVTVVWLWLMNRAIRVLQGPAAIWCPLIAHALVAGYLCSIIGLIFTALSLAVALMIEPAASGVYVLKLLGAFLLLLLILFGCRHVEYRIAKTCIRHYLLRTPTS